MHGLCLALARHPQLVLHAGRVLRTLRALHDDGYRATEHFLDTWNWQDYLRRFRRHPS